MRISKARPNARKPKLTVEDFAEAAPVGTPVRYYAVLPADEDDFIESAIRSAPWHLGGRIVVMIESVSGGVDVGHLVILGAKKPIPGVAGFKLDNAP